MGLRASIPTRRAAVVLVIASAIVSLTINRAIAQASEAVAAADAQTALNMFAPTTSTTRSPTVRPPRVARVLLLGDSVMDQQGSAAAFLLRQAGIDAHTIGLWGSGLLTVDEYDFGKTNLSGMWFSRAHAEIARTDPDVVGVYLNHNYLLPYPHDAAGNEIADLWSAAGQQMIEQQARAFITILRSRGARVFFVAPVPAGATSDPDPLAWNAIWHGYAPVLNAMHVPVADSAEPLQGTDGLRVETKLACDGSEQRIRPPDDIHLTRFGAGLAGTALARYVATSLHTDLLDDAAPGDRTAALVPTLDGRGYWLVGCDGSVFHFGSAPSLPGATSALAGHGGTAAAVRTPNGSGLWLVAGDGTIASVGDAPPLAFDHEPSSAIVGATAQPDAIGIWATTASGDVLRAGAAGDEGKLAPDARHAPIVGIAASAHGRGYLLAGADGEVFAFGAARGRGAADGLALGDAVTGIAATADGNGYWLTTRDGRVFALGDAAFRGGAVWHAPPPPVGYVVATPGPAAGISAAPRSNAGYWVFGTTGRVVARGDAHPYGGDNGLAMFTP